MFRSLLVIGGIFCATVVLAEVLMAGVLWFSGSLTADSLRDIRLALQGGSAAQPERSKDEAQVQLPSQDDIQESRLTRILQLDARETELKILKRMTADTAIQLISDRQAFDQLKVQFRTELERLEEQNQSEATEQIRTILMATAPEDAVLRLMGLPPEDAVDLMRGLPEKTIARILAAFQTDPKTAARGKSLFESLYRGEPKRALIQDTFKSLTPTPEALRRGG